MPCTHTATDPALTVHDSLDCYLDGIKNLPPTPILMIKLISLFRQPNCDVDEIVSLTRRDPALVAEVLRQCNGAFFGGQEPVLDVNEAVFRLGFHEVYRLAVALFGMQAMTLPGGADRVLFEKLRLHSGITALAASAIAREVGESEGIIFTAGLLHDVGKVALAAQEGVRYTALLRQYDHAGGELSKAEKMFFGFDHGEVGARLLMRWGVPEEVSLPALLHHRVAGIESLQRPVAIVYLANLMSHHIQQETGGALDELPETRRAMELLEFQSADLVDIACRVRRNQSQLPSLQMA